MAELTSLKNIGKELSAKLLGVGISSPEMLHRAGAKGAYLKMRKQYPNVCLVHLYALHCAVENIEIKGLSEQARNELKAFDSTLKD